MKKTLLISLSTLFLSFSLEANIHPHSLQEQCKRKKCDIEMFEEIIGFQKEIKKEKTIKKEREPEDYPVECNKSNNECRNIKA